MVPDFIGLEGRKPRKGSGQGGKLRISGTFSAAFESKIGAGESVPALPPKCSPPEESDIRMFRSLKLGTAFGIGIYVHWSFPFLLVLVAFLGRSAGMAGSVYAVALVLAIFTCVVLHELGHALMARRFGIGTRDITLLPIGGVARLEKIIDRPWEEFWIAVAGPAVNLVIAGGLLGILVLAGVDLSLKALFQSATIGASQELMDLERFSFIERLGMGLLVTNIFLMTFNMIPAFPMGLDLAVEFAWQAVAAVRPAADGGNPDARLDL